MKTRYLILVAMGLLIVFASGCATNARLWQVENGITFSSSGFIGPKEMSEAQINMAIAKQIRSGHAGEFAGEYTGVIINLETSQSFHFYHPSRNAMIKIQPKGCRFIKTTEVPNRIFGKFACEEGIEEFKIYKKSKVYDSIKIDFGCRVKN